MSLLCRAHSQAGYSLSLLRAESRFLFPGLTRRLQLAINLQPLITSTEQCA
jgi:hypothetical protein